jgi:hypothetical protein
LKRNSPKREGTNVANIKAYGLNTPLMLKCLLASGLAVGSITALRAADAPAEKSPTREEWQKMTPEQREARNKEMREKFEKMTPEQREALRKTWRERMEKRIDQLKKKETDGAITDTEKKQLEQWVKRLKVWDQKETPEKSPEQPPEKK